MMLKLLNDTLRVIWRWRRSVGKEKKINNPKQIARTHNLYITFSVNSMLLLNVLAIHAHTKTKDMDAFIPHVYSTQFHLTVWFLLPDVRIQNLYQRQWRICRFGVFVVFLCILRLFAKYLQMASNVISISLFLLSSANHVPICKWWNKCILNLYFLATTFHGYLDGCYSLVNCHFYFDLLTIFLQICQK